MAQLDIKLLLESGHSKRINQQIVNYVGNDKNKFKQLITIFFKGDYRLTQRAAWALGDIGVNQTQLIKPYLKQLVECLGNTNLHPAVNRNVLRILELIDIPEQHQSQILNSCFTIITNASSPIASIAYALTIACKICKPYPELIAEFVIILNHLKTNPQPPAINSRLKKVYKVLKC
jgi:hypothetical protein